MATIIERTQHEVARLISVVESDLDRRGVLMIDRAHSLLSAVKGAKLTMSLSEQTTPASFFDDEWYQQANTLKQFEARLQRIIKGVAIPVEDHERI